MAANPLAPSWLRPPADPAALESGIWPRTACRDERGVLAVGGVAADALVERHGSPLYVLDEQDVRARAAEAREAFTREFDRIGTSASVYYAGKAFLSTEVVRWVTEAGLGVDVCTGGELALALAAGADAARLGFHGNNKSDAELERAIAAGVGSIVLDGEEEIERVAAEAERQGRRQPVRLRVNSGVHAHTHDFLATAHEDQKFGVTLAEAPGLVARIRAAGGLEFLGLHCHIGSQIFGTDGFAESARRLLEVHAGLLADGPVPELNLGGGFGIAYTSADEPTPVAELARSLADIVAAECARLEIPLPRASFEPGRSIVGPAGVTLYTLGARKDLELSGPDGAAVRRYLGVDGGMSDNARPALYEADYTPALASRASRAEPTLVRLAGRHCESGDIVVNDAYLPADAGRGDLVAVAATGAYCWELASNYNLVPRPPVVAVREGRSRVIVHGETIDGLLARDAGLTAVTTGGAEE